MFTTLAGGAAEGLLFAIAVLGMAISFRLLDFPDLAFDGCIVLGGAIATTLILAGVPQPWPLFAALAGGGLAGCWTAFLHSYLRIGKLLSGVVTLTMLFTINLRIMGSANLSVLDSDTIFLAAGGVYGTLAISAIAAMIASALAGYFLMSEAGLALRGAGMNPLLAASLGRSVRRYIFLGLIMSNALIAGAGALIAQYHRFSDISSGVGAFMVGLSALLLGESLLRPRRVSIFVMCALVGGVSFFVLVAIALRIGLEPRDLKFVNGLILLAVLCLQRRQRPFVKSSW